MLISDRNRVVTIEAGLGALACAGVGALIAPGDPALAGVTLHPAWVTVAVMSARYGLLGFTLALPLSWLAVALAVLVLTGDLSLLGARVTSLPDLAILCASLLVAWIAQGQHAGRQRLSARLAELEGRAADEHETMRALMETISSLRARADRSEMSITFVRDVARRIAYGDRTVAAGAVLELALARTGARGGFLQVVEGGAVRTIAWRGVWHPERAIPPEIMRDATVQRALHTLRAVDVRELESARHHDADLAAPVLSHPDGGEPVGVLALCGVPLESLNPGKRDLMLLGEWLAAALVASSRTVAPALVDDDTSMLSDSDDTEVTQLPLAAAAVEIEAAEPELAAPAFAVHDESRRRPRRRVARGTDVNGAVRRRHQTIPPGFWSTCKALLEVEGPPGPTPSPVAAEAAASPPSADEGTSDGPVPAKRVIWG